MLAAPASRLGDNFSRAYQINTGILTTGASTSALRPGDIVLTIPSSDGVSTILNGEGKAHIQSFSFSIPLARTVLGRIGNTFGYARVINVPMNMEVSIGAQVSELQEYDMFDHLCSFGKNEFSVTLKGCDGTPQMEYRIRGAIIQSESFSNSIGDGESVDLTYTVQIGGANDPLNNIFMSGAYLTPTNVNGSARQNNLDAILTGFYRLGAEKDYKINVSD
jgi:hypothetical protein